jgi:hypothetical protein
VDFSPRGTEMRKKCSLQAFVRILQGNFFVTGRFEELKPDREFRVAISTLFCLRPCSFVPDYTRNYFN